MKKSILILSILTALLPLTALCQQGWLPPESTTSVEEGIMTVSSPAGWRYVGTQEDGSVAVADVGADGTISCTCNSSGKCMPFKGSSLGGSTSGCAGSCTNCTMLQSVVSGGIDVNIKEGGYYNPNLETVVIASEDKYPSVFAALTQLPAFQTKLQEFYENAYNGQPIVEMTDVDGEISAPDGYSLLCIAIMGRGLLVIVPDSYAITMVGSDVNASASCSCTEGNCELKSGSIGLASAKYCDGNCTGTCSLTTGVKPSDGQQYAVELIHYSY
tara:strand:+ start:362 stop:1177 length:816 start_codon:yes stop_codon:yes gene_type:complete